MVGSDSSVVGLLSRGNHFLCTIRNYGRFPAINLRVEYETSFCDRKFTAAETAEVPTIGAGDQSGVLFANVDPIDEASIEVLPSTTFITPPLNDRMPYQYPGWDSESDSGWMLSLGPVIVPPPPHVSLSSTSACKLPKPSQTQRSMAPPSLTPGRDNGEKFAYRFYRARSTCKIGHGGRPPRG